MLNILKYIFTAFSSALLLLSPVLVSAQTDTASDKKAAKPAETTDHMLSFSIDASQPIINAFVSSRQGYEFAIDYYAHKELYYVLEGGWGNAKVDYSDLKYKTSNTFARVGINRCLIQRLAPDDWDMVFLGFRLGMASVSRSNATYTVVDSLWGNSSGAISSQTVNAFWAEITGGMRAEIVNNFFIGYTIRGKFLLNESAFKTLAPLYVAGYGKGDKTAVFDFNLYLTYSIKKKRHLHH